MTRITQLLSALLLFAICAPDATAQRNKEKKNAPENCMVCEGDPEAMAFGKIVSHGGFDFGRTDTDGVDKLLANLDIRWIESEHFQIGFAGPPYKVSTNEKKPVLAELTEMLTLFPEIKPKQKVLDPWLRAHQYAYRCEKMYTRFMEIMEVTQDDFPKGIEQWDGIGTYWGEGPYLGQRHKYEILIVPAEGDLSAYLSDQFGLQTKMTNRWNVVEFDTISVTMHLREGDRKKDMALHGHVAFNIAHNLLDGFKHYSYDTQIWLHEGLGHYFERKISPKNNSFDSGEGSASITSKKADWKAEVLKIIRTGEIPRMAELVSIKNYADLSLSDHYVTWSMVTFLIEMHPTAFANINKTIHGRLAANGLQDSSNLNDIHREAFKEELGMSYNDFDSAWREWALHPPLVDGEDEDDASKKGEPEED